MQTEKGPSSHVLGGGPNLLVGRGTIRERSYFGIPAVDILNDILEGGSSDAASGAGRERSQQQDRDSTNLQGRIQEFVLGASPLPSPPLHLRSRLGPS